MPFQEKLCEPALSAIVPVKAVCPDELVIVRFAVAGEAAVRFQMAELPVALDSVAVWPPTVTVEPTSCSADVASEVCCIEISVCRLVFMLILDASELDELLGELIGVERIERILIL